MIAPDDAPAEVLDPVARQPGSLRRALRSGTAVVSAATIAVLVVVAVFAGPLAPQDPYDTDLLAVYQPPRAGHLLGTDRLGRDILSRTVYGARTSLLAASEAVLVSLVLGVPLGLVAGYFKGWKDRALSLGNDAIMSVPGLIFALAIVAVLGAGLEYAMFAIGIVFTPRVFRVTRAAAADVGSQLFIEACRSLGYSRARIVLLHVLPNTLSPLIIVVSVSFATAVLSEAGLSFIGLGARPPTASWGGMLSDASLRLDLRYLVYPPGIALMITSAAFTFFGDAMRRALGSRRVVGDA